MSAGFVGFVVDSQEKLTYVPGIPKERIERSMSLWLHTCHPEVIRGIAQRMRLVTNKDRVKAPDIQRLHKYADPSVAEPKTWFDLLWATRADVGQLLAAGVMQDLRAMPLNWRAIKWGFVVDLDTETLNEYEGLHLVHTWPLSDLPAHDSLTSILKGTQ